MASVQWMGDYRTRIISASEWDRVGAPGPTVSWNAENGWSIPESAFTQAQLDVLDDYDGFLIGQPDGPRPYPPNVNLGYERETYESAYYREIKEIYEEIIDIPPIPETISNEIASQVPPAVQMETEIQVPPAVTADIQSRNLTAVDLGNSTVQFQLGGVDMGDPYTLPGAAWSSLAGKPAVLAAGANQAEARSAVDAWGPSRRDIRRARPGVVRRVQAPGNLSWLDSHIRVFYDGHKFFTDFDVTTKRHTGTKRYSDRENGHSGNSGLATALSAPLVGGTSVTSLSVSPLPSGFPSGSKVVIFAQDNLGEWHSMSATLSSAGATGATTISVNPVVVNYSYPIGSVVASPKNTVYGIYTEASPSDNLILLDRKSNSYGGTIDRLGGWGISPMEIGTIGTTAADLSTSGQITSIPVTPAATSTNSGSQVTLNSPDKLHYQQFILSATAPAGATSLSVVPQTPNYAYPSGSDVKKANKISKSITIASQFPGETKFIIGDWHGAGGVSQWALKPTYTNVYTVSRSLAIKVVDSGIGEYGMEYKKVANASACESLPGSYYINGSEVGVHYIMGGSPDPKRVHVLISDEAFTIRNENGDMSVYLEGFSVYGGKLGALFEALPGGNLDVFCYRMNFLYSVSTNYDAANALNIMGCRFVFLQECRAAFSPKDGFSYHQYNRNSTYLNSTRFIEVDCEAWSCGIGNTIAGAENRNNASTAHEGAHGIRMGGHYHETTGAVIGDVHVDTETWNVECVVWESLSTDTTLDAGISAQQAGTTIHVWNCRVFDTRKDIEARADTTINVYNTEYDSISSAGTINMLTGI